MTVNDVGGAQASTAATGTVADQLTTTGEPLSAVEGSAFSGLVVSFTDADTSTSAGTFTANVSWGDGTTSTGSVTGGRGSFTVNGSHTYTEEDPPSGPYPVTVSVTDSSTGKIYALATTATVADAPLTGAGSSFTSPNPVSYVVATFKDADPAGTVSDYTATINWGDGTTSPGSVSAPLKGTTAFTVSGTHSYVVLGPYTITTTICDVGGSCTTVTSRVLVFGYSSGEGAFVVGDVSAGALAAGTPVQFWGAQWAKVNVLSGGPAPDSFKGFETYPALPACGLNWAADPGNSGHPPSTVPTYMAVIVSSQVTNSGSTISGNSVHVVVVKTDPGYAGDPGHAGTGTIAGTYC